jgi:cysteine desulfurase
MKIDLLSLSGHKIYGPKGVGALYVRQNPLVRLQPLLFGGGQEKGLRSGTLPVPQIVGLGKAAQLAAEQMSSDYDRIAALSDHFLSELEAAIPGLHLNGDRDVKRRIAGNINISIEGVKGESLMLRLKGLALSSGSACASGSLEPSYVLMAIGVSKPLISSALRIGIGRFTTAEEVELAVKAIKTAVDEIKPSL